MCPPSLTHACPTLDALYQPKGTIFILLVMIQLGMKSTSPTGCAIPSQKGSTGNQLEKMKKAKKKKSLGEILGRGAISEKV